MADGEEDWPDLFPEEAEPAADPGDGEEDAAQPEDAAADAEEAADGAAADDTMEADGEGEGEAPAALEEKKEWGWGGRNKGRIIKIGAKTGNMLIQNRGLTEQYGQEVVVRSSDWPKLEMRDLISFDVEVREGQRPLAIQVMKVEDDGGKGKGKGKKGKDDPVEWTYYVGLATPPPEKNDPKCTINCPRVAELFGQPAWFPAKAWPEGLQEGGSVVFRVEDRTQIGDPPRAFDVAKLAVPQSLVKQASQGKGVQGKGGGKSKSKSKSNSGKGGTQNGTSGEVKKTITADVGW